MSDSSAPKIDMSGEAQRQSKPHTTVTMSTQKAFPYRLHDLLTTEAALDALWWLPGDEAFALEPVLICSKILDIHFHGMQLTSFLRRLHKLGFRRHSRGFKKAAGTKKLPENAIVFSHEYFQKDAPELLDNLSEKPPKAKASKKNDNGPDPKKAPAQKQPPMQTPAQTTKSAPPTTAQAEAAPHCPAGTVANGQHLVPQQYSSIFLAGSMPTGNSNVTAQMPDALALWKRQQQLQQMWNTQAMRQFLSNNDASLRNDRFSGGLFGSLRTNEQMDQRQQLEEQAMRLGLLQRQMLGGAHASAAPAPNNNAPSVVDPVSASDRERLLQDLAARQRRQSPQNLADMLEELRRNRRI